jgi:Tfp pilus assembly protein PilE
MPEQRFDEAGFGLVEVIIAFFLLAIISVALLPALWNGVIQSSTQATTASATRFLYAVVEQGRESAETAGGASAWCTDIGDEAANAPATFSVTVTACTADANSLVTLTLTAVSSESSPKHLATVTAKVYVP